MLRSSVIRLLTFPLPVFALVACASAPASPSIGTVIIEGAIEDGFDCAMREVNERGFTVTSAERASGFLQAERGDTGVVDAVLGGLRTMDQLTVALYRDAEEGTRMRITAERVELQVRGENRGARTTRAGSSDGRAAAGEILDACGTALSSVTFDAANGRPYLKG